MSCILQTYPQQVPLKAPCHTHSPTPSEAGTPFKTPLQAPIPAPSEQPPAHPLPSDIPSPGASKTPCSPPSTSHSQVPHSLLYMRAPCLLHCTCVSHPPALFSTSHVLYLHPALLYALTWYLCFHLLHPILEYEPGLDRAGVCEGNRLGRDGVWRLWGLQFCGLHKCRVQKNVMGD